MKRHVLARVHLAVSILSIAGFLASGLFMHFRHDHLRGMENTMRMIFRATHLDLLLLGLINLHLGLYLARRAAPWTRRLQAIGSALLIVAPFIGAIAFLTEPGLPEMQRPWTPWAIYAAFGGSLLHLVAARSDFEAMRREDSAS